MSVASPPLNSPKDPVTLEPTNKKKQKNKGSKKRKRESDDLYKPLNLGTREIRLLHVKPNLNLTKQPRCFLETVSLDDNPQFEALSYVWGDPGLKRPIRLENREWYATINLEAGLRYLRSPSKDIVIWVDALCIDENSVDERNSQILLMKTIYSKAKRVRIWLGEPTRGSDDALAILEHLGRSIPFSDIHLDGQRMRNEHVKYAEYLIELMNRPWWNRVWVQQEHILAKDVTLHCGLRSIDFSAILKFGDLNDFTKGLEGKLFDNAKLVGCMQRISDSRFLHQHDNRTGAYDMTFAGILARGCFKNCTNPRDSIYGFLGLAQEDVVDAIKPDYGISLKEVLQRTAVKHIICTGSLSFFPFTTWKTKDKRLLPTWVPDWPRLGPFDLSNVGSPQNMKREQWRCRIRRFETITKFKACATRSLTFDPVDETTVMLNGNCSGEVTDVSPDNTYLPGDGWLVSCHDLNTRIESWLKFFDQFADHTAFPCSTEGRESPFWRIFIGDRYNRERGIWRTCEKIDYEAYQAMKRELVADRLVTSGANDYCTSLLYASAGRRLFATDRGYIGLGPPEMQKGDHVYILSGGQVPYILRPVSGPRPRTFDLVGDCYLHGIMHGEAAGTDEDFHDVFLE